MSLISNKGITTNKNIMEYKILERNGIFLVGTTVRSRQRLLGKPKLKFESIWMGPYKPAHFKTLEEAREFVRIITKPDTYHPVNP